jgi:hypothetical protein
LYLTTFSLALGMGAALDAYLRRSSNPGRRLWFAGVIVALHVVDLSAHARPFIRTRSPALSVMPSAESLISERLGEARVAIDYNLALDFNRRFDDVGFMDSIMLARPYRALLRLSGAPEDANLQALQGSALPARALSNLGVQYVVTRRVRRDLPLALSDPYHVYLVPFSTRRASFFPQHRIQFLDEVDMIERLGADDFHLAKELMLPVEARTEIDASGKPMEPAGELELEYARPGPDRIELRVDAPGPGIIRVLESWDPGWSASVDGVRSPVLRADSFALAVAVDPGEHRVVLDFETPGAQTGVILSLSSLSLLLGLLWSSRRAGRAVTP